MQAGVGVRLEYDAQFRCAGEELLVVRRQQGAREIVGGSGMPVGTQLDEQPVTVHRHRRIGRCVDADQFAGRR